MATMGEKITPDGNEIPRNHEYKFVRLGENWLGVKKSGRNEYQDTVHRYAGDGWRLVQVFAPSIGIHGVSGYYELILENEMPRKYEYKFVRLGEGWLAVKKSGKNEYQDTAHRYAGDGWRLVQVFAPSIGRKGMSGYYELILEREAE